MVVLTTIGWGVAPMIRKMVDKIDSYIMGQYHWQRDLEKDLRKLKDALLRIQVMVEAAEKWQTVTYCQNQLLQRLEDDVNEADNFLDEFDYWVMEARALEARGIVSHGVYFVKKYSKRIFGLEKLPNKLKEILEKLDDADKNAKRLIKVRSTENESTAEQANVEPNLAICSNLATEILGRNKEEDEIVNLFKQVYDCLPKKQQLCFVYCSIFPKGWRFDPNKLVHHWIAQNYIWPKNGELRKLEDIGKDYFNDLLSKFFFRILEVDSFKYYVMHDLLHHLAVSISLDECFQFEGHRPKTIPQNVQHLGVVVGNAEECKDFIARVKKMHHLEKLHTLSFFKGLLSSTIAIHATPSLFKKFRSLRVLEFGDLELEEFPNLGHMPHLRYLDIGNNGFEILPKSSCGLYNLQVLASSQGLYLSKSIMQLIKYGKLECLNVPRLKFHVEKKRGHTIGVLKDMVVRLEGVLCIKNLQNVTCKEEAMEADLGSKKDLYGLELEWGSSGRIKRHDAFEEVAEALKPHQTLKWLGINGFRGKRSPIWLERERLENLKTIRLCNCECMEVLPSLGHLPVLKELEIIGMPALRKVGSEFYGVDNRHGVRGFPSLESLKFENMPEWSEWCDAEFPVFPRLLHLDVQQSPKLMRFPVFPPTLRGFAIRNIGLISSRYSGLSSTFVPSRALLHDQLIASIEELEIVECKEPMPAGGIVERAPLKMLVIRRCYRLVVLHTLTFLSYLGIHECKELTSLGGLHALTFLKYLRVRDCPKLKLLPEEGLPASIQTFIFDGCGVPNESLVRCLQGLTSLRHLTVRDCPKLKLLPEEGLPASIQVFIFNGCGVPNESLSEEALPAFYKGLTSFFFLTVGFCKNNILDMSLKINKCGVSDTLLSICLRWFTSIRNLNIYHCNDLTCLPSAQVLHRLTALKSLSLRSCKELRSLGGLHALPVLKILLYGKLQSCIDAADKGEERPRMGQGCSHP